MRACMRCLVGLCCFLMVERRELLGYRCTTGVFSWEALMENAMLGMENCSGWLADGVEACKKEVEGAVVDVSGYCRDRDCVAVHFHSLAIKIQIECK